MSEALVRRLLWEVRLLRILVIVLGIGGASIMAQDVPLNDSPILTRELTVARRDKGESFRLSADRRATLELRDEEGRVRVRLGLTAKGPSLLVFDERGRSQEMFGPSYRTLPLTER
jgi:hypothetical protein